LSAAVSSRLGRSARRVTAAGPRPVALAAAIIIILPIAALVVLAGSGDFAYLRHLADTRLLAYTRNSVTLGVLVTAGTCLTAVPAAWLTARYRFPSRAFFSWALALPLAAPAYVTAYAYASLTTAGGPVYEASNGLVPAVRGMGGAAFIFTLALYPYVYLLARQAFVSQAAHAFDAARTLGAGPMESFWRIGLPLARPAIAAGVALAVMETLADYGAVEFLGAPTLTAGIIRAWTSFGEAETAARLSLILLLATCFAFAFERGVRQGRGFAQSSGRDRPNERVPLSLRGAGIAILFCSLLLGLALIVPAGRLIWLAFDTPGVRSPVPALLNTIQLASMSAVIAVLIGLGSAYAIRTGGWLSVAAARAAQTGYAIPGAVAAVGVLALLGFLQRVLDSGLGSAAPVVTGGSLIALLFAYQSRFAAAAIGPAEAALTNVSASLDAAAQTLGAGPGRIIRRIHLPLISGGLGAAGLIVFVEVMKELPATMILRPFDFETLAIMAHNYAADERLAQAALPSLMLIGLGLPAMIAVSWLATHNRKRRTAR